MANAGLHLTMATSPPSRPVFGYSTRTRYPIVTPPYPIMARLFDHIGPTAQHAPSEFHRTSTLYHRRRRTRTICFMSMISFSRPISLLHEQVVAGGTPSVSRRDFVVGKKKHLLERRVVASLMVSFLSWCRVLRWLCGRRERERAFLRCLFGGRRERGWENQIMDIKQMVLVRLRR